MRGMAERIIHSFEAGRRGKPDELESGLAHLIGAYFLERNPLARFDVRVAGGFSRALQKPRLCISGEVSASVLTEDTYPELHRRLVAHYNKVHQSHLDTTDFVWDFFFKSQADSLAANSCAGDSGNPIAVAYRTSPHHLPWERYLAVEIRDLIDHLYQDSPSGLAGLQPDGKVGVEAVYSGSRLVNLSTITLAVQHDHSLSIEALRLHLGGRVSELLGRTENRYSVSLGTPLLVINGLGAWHTGGWEVDEGTREAKPYRDGFGTYGCMEDSFSGEDPTKPSATGTFLARYIAVQVVAHGLADFARVALGYTIGREEVGLNITSNGTGKLPQEKLEAWVRDNIPLRISDGITRFGLCNPKLYRGIVDSSDFFHASSFPWNKKGNYAPPPLSDSHRGRL